MTRIGNKYQAGRVFGDPNIVPQIGDEYQTELPRLTRDSDDPLGDLRIMPRVGDEYQVELPQLTRDPDDPFGDRTRVPRIGGEYQAELPPLGETNVVRGLRDQGHTLVPRVDIKKFDPKHLTKGDQFFDSVTEVLSRVAQYPGLISLDSEDEPRPSDASSSSNEHLSSWVIALPAIRSTEGSSSDSSEDPRPHMPFDLNLPYMGSEDVDFVMESTNEQDVTSQEMEDPGCMLDLEMRIGPNPMTKSTYDAAHGYFTVRRSNKRKEAWP